VGFKQLNKMKKYNYFYYGTPIQRRVFLSNVPESWESEVDEYGGYSYGGYRAELIEE